MVNIIETNLQPRTGLNWRYNTDLIVIHHTGSEHNGQHIDNDLSAEEIDHFHKYGNNWSMIGYNFVIRKNGAIERGRPIDSVGAHVGDNHINPHSIGIHLCGNFFVAEPTFLQIESVAELLAELTANYNIPCDRDHIVGHREVGNSDCPGDNLYNVLDEIVGKANFYRYGPGEE